MITNQDDGVSWNRNQVLEKPEELSKTSYMTITVSTKGQVVIPRGARQKLGIRPGDKLTTKVVDGYLVMHPVNKPRGKARVVTSPDTGLPAIDPPAGAPELTSEQVRTILAEFP